MSKKYICEICNEEFNQKIDFTKHKNKKTSCVLINTNDTNIKEVKTDIKTKLSTIFKYCLDVLRNNDHITGDKALRTLAHLLNLRLLEYQFKNQIDIDNYNYDFSSYEDNIIEEHKAKLLNMVRFSNLAKEKEENIPKIMKCLWEEILSVHPITKNIFLKGKGFDIQHQSTYKKIIDKLYTFDFEAIDEDILGEAYEEVIKDVMTGKVLGQFFTPPKVKQMMIKLIDPQLKDDGTIEKIFDPAMGTGGFLISSLRHLLNQSKTKKIPMNWEFISNEGLGGREAESDTYQLAVSNMLISSGHMFKVLEQGDSIRDPITNKYDIILANPPFGIDGLIYDEILNPLRNDYMPIKSNSAVPLFLQAIINMLKINGRCAVVLPNGKELFSKTNDLVRIREFLMKTCDLKEIIYLPPGIFTHTTIKTCVLYFIKKKEGNEVLETKTKISKIQKEIGRDYKFTKTHQTTKVKFYDFNPYEDIKNLLVEVAIEKIANNSYSLNYTEYMKDETKEKEYNDEIEIKTLGELFKLNGNGKTNSKDITNTGEYPFYKASCKNPSGTHNTYDFDGNEYLLIVKSGGSSSKPISENYGIGKIFIVNGKCAANIAVFQLLPKTNNNFKYLSYYLKFIQNKIQELAKYCTNNGNIDMNELMKIKIPIPSLERQEEIVKYLDFIYEKTIKTSNEKIAELKTLNEYCLNNQKLYGANIIKNLGEVCNFENGKRIVKNSVEIGEYPVLGGGGFTSFYTNEYSREGKTCKISREGMSLHNCVMILNEKYYLNSQAFTIKSINETFIINDYLWYYLNNNKTQVFECGRGPAQKAIDMNIFKLIKIPIPSFERQKEIVEYCEHNDMLIKQLKKEIENNKAIAQQFITSILKSQITTEEFQEKQEEILSVDNDSNKDDNDDKSSVSSKSSVKQLKEQCKSLGIKGFSKLNKNELIKLINKSQ